MGLPLTTQKRADTVSLGIFLIGLGMIIYLDSWWPGILLAIGASLVIRQFLRGRDYDMVISTIVFGGLFSYFYFKVDWANVMAVLFTVGGIYLIFREYFVTKQRVGREQIEEERQNLEEEVKEEREEKDDHHP